MTAIVCVIVLSVSIYVGDKWLRHRRWLLYSCSNYQVIGDEFETEDGDAKVLVL